MRAFRLWPRVKISTVGDCSTLYCEASCPDLAVLGDVHRHEAGVREKSSCARLAGLNRVVACAGLVEEHDDLAVALELGVDQERRLLNREVGDTLVLLVEARARAELAESATRSVSSASSSSSWFWIAATSSA